MDDFIKCRECGLITAPLDALGGLCPSCRGAAGAHGLSQDDYCKGCANVIACNVVLKDGEECGDRIEDARTQAAKDIRAALGLDAIFQHGPKCQDTKEKCPNCGSKNTRPLECEEHGKDCPVDVCRDCGGEVYDWSVKAIDFRGPDPDMKTGEEMQAEIVAGIPYAGPLFAAPDGGVIKGER